LELKYNNINTERIKYKSKNSVLYIQKSYLNTENSKFQKKSTTNISNLSNNQVKYQIISQNNGETK